MNIRYPLYEGVYRILTKEFGQNFIVAVLSVREIWTIENRESC